MTAAISPRTRTVRGVLTILFALGLLASLEVFSRLLLQGAGSDGMRQMVRVSIPDGASVTKVAEILYSHGLIEHPVLFRYAVRLMGADTKLQAGSVLVASGQSMFELIRNLTRAKALGVAVLIREGRTSMDIASILQRRMGVDSADFMAAIRDTALIAQLELDAPSLEGYLFPDTYFIAEGTDPRRIAERMVANFRLHLPDDIDEQLERRGMTLNDAVALASIIEWETLVQHEAPLISSVYHNRLHRGMLLQADPTVAYALGKGPSRLYYSDLKVDSPYNTYLYEGLPPGAINNPGRRALDAALNPAQSNYLYFVARGDGTHAFTTSFADHLDAKQVLDRARRSAKTAAESGISG